MVPQTHSPVENAEAHGLLFPSLFIRLLSGPVEFGPDPQFARLQDSWLPEPTPGKREALGPELTRWRCQRGVHFPGPSDGGRA